MEIEKKDPINFKTYKMLGSDYNNTYYRNNKFRYTCKFCNSEFSIIKSHYESVKCKEARELKGL